jgi:hypothetical protein
MEILDPLEKYALDYTTFRTNIREAFLNASNRAACQPSLFDSAVEILSIVVMVVNFIYVMLTSQFQADMFDASAVIVGSFITFAALVELAIRCNPLKMTYFPMTRLNAIFDALALVGAVVS